MGYFLGRVSPVLIQGNCHKKGKKKALERYLKKEGS
jgi:hypothetical protein